MVDKTKKDNPVVKKSLTKTQTGKPVDHKVDINPQLKNENNIEHNDDGIAIPISERKALTIQQRQARARLIQRIEPKLIRSRELAKKRIASDSQIKNRAMVQARELIKKRFAARRNVSYTDLTLPEKIQVDKAVEKKVALIKKIAMRLLPKIRKAEYERIKSFVSGAKLQDLSTQVVVQSFDDDLDLDTLTEAITEAVCVVDEAIDSKNAEILLRAGLADRRDIQKYRRVLGNLDDSIKNPQYRNYLLKMLRRIMDVITNDTTIFSKTRSILQRKKLSENALISLQRKSEKYNLPLDIVVEVYSRGVIEWESLEDSNMTYEQYGFSRLNSFLNSGKAIEEDYDLVEFIDSKLPGTPRLAKNRRTGALSRYRATVPAQERIAPKLVKPISKGRRRRSIRSSGKNVSSTPRAYKRAITNRFTIVSDYNIELDNMFSDFIQEAKNTPKEREVGTTTLRKIYTKDTPCQEETELEEMKGANMDRRKLVSDISSRGWKQKDSGRSGDHDVFEHPNSSRKLAIPRQKSLKAPMILNLLKQSKVMDIKEEHDKCGTPECCGQCDTSTNLNESFTMAFDYFGKPSYGPTVSDLMMKAKGGYETHPDVEIVETVNAIKSRIIETFDRYVLTEGEDYEGKMARGELNALIKKAQNLIGKFQDDNKEIDAWVQAKITKAADYINSVNDYLNNNKQDVDEEAKSADKKPVIVPAHKDAYGNVIPARSELKRTNRVIVNTGDNPNDGK